MLNNEQSRALKFIASGHSCVVLGQAGTGKSYLIKEMLKTLDHKNVSVTASTGLAARQFKEATTIHHWAGLMDGRFENQHLLHIISEETRNRIKTCSILIIDEISNISRKVFEQLEFICRSVRDPSLYFGGLQSDKDLILAINELERGIPSHQTNQLMLAIERPLSTNNPCVLFGTNFEVDCFNMTELHKMQGESTSYVAEKKANKHISAR